MRQGQRCADCLRFAARDCGFRPGSQSPNRIENCTGCHSADYISTQPRELKSKQDFWKAEVNKMVKVYGAPIPETEIAKIVEYLAQTY